MAISIAPAGTADLDDLRSLFREYAGWLQVDYCLKDFEAELAGLPGACTPPAGGLWIARVDGEVAGAVALRQLGGGEAEVKRLWVRAPYRGLKLGRGLAEAALEGARAGGHERVVLETLGFMTTAQALYADLGFREVPKGDAPASVRKLACDLTAAAPA
ncbi:MAG: GNAT family N-acetyltransferase [Kiloniellaceae bacterium]